MDTICTCFKYFQKNHGQPSMTDNRHVGDLGNILTPLNRVTPIYIKDSLITLDKDAENGINGLAIVIHAGEDDLGMGGDEGK